jgi:hypothetical protein
MKSGFTSIVRAKRHHMPPCSSKPTFMERLPLPQTQQIDKITIHPSKNLIGNRLSIHDNTGRTVAAGELRDYTIDLSDFFPGMYLLKIDGEKPMKIIKR